MKNSEKHQQILIHLIFIITAGLMLASLIENYNLGEFSFSSNWQFIGYLWMVLTFLSILVAILSFTDTISLVKKAFKWSVEKFQKLKWGNMILFILILFVYSYLVFGPQSKHFNGFFFRATILWLLAGLGAFLLKGYQPSKKTSSFFILSILIITAFYQSATNLRDINTLPFSLSWSEGSRFYYASLPFAQSLYGQFIPLSFLHPSRYLIMSLPFIIPGLPLWVHRAWQVFLWISMLGLGCYLLVRRLHPVDPIKAAALAAWSFIFLFQGPVYYHLMVCIVLILWGFDKNNFKKSLLFVVIASIWAGISRINWFPVPGALSATLYVLESPFDDTKKWGDYFKQPIILGVVGTAISFIAQAAYIPLSGNQDLSSFGSSFTSDLLWYRLLPSPTFPLGILTGILLLCAPLLIFVISFFLNKQYSIHFLRKLFLLGICSIFFIGGLVVSVKIGGGSNLHNMDSFCILLLCSAAYIFFEKINLEKKQPLSLNWLCNLLLIGLILIPIGFSISNWAQFPTYDKSAAYEEMQSIEKILSQVESHKQESLLISERQLLTFNYIKNIHLVPEYELLTLMEMAISNNQEYLNHFYTDLKNQRFAIIIAEKQYVTFKDTTNSFPEENNAWVKDITVPLLEYYQPITWLRTTDLEIYARRDLTIQP
jgi:hypothetical protein